MCLSRKESITCVELVLDNGYRHLLSFLPFLVVSPSLLPCGLHKTLCDSTQIYCLTDKRFTTKTPVRISKNKYKVSLYRYPFSKNCNQTDAEQLGFGNSKNHGESKIMKRLGEPDTPNWRWGRVVPPVALCSPLKRVYDDLDPMRSAKMAGPPPSTDDLKKTSTPLPTRILPVCPLQRVEQPSSTPSGRAYNKQAGRPVKRRPEQSPNDCNKDAGRHLWSKLSCGASR